MIFLMRSAWFSLYIIIMMFQRFEVKFLICNQTLKFKFRGFNEISKAALVYLKRNKNQFVYIHANNFQQWGYILRCKIHQNINSMPNGGYRSLLLNMTSAKHCSCILTSVHEKRTSRGMSIWNSVVYRYSTLWILGFKSAYPLLLDLSYKSEFFKLRIIIFW